MSFIDHSLRILRQNEYRITGPRVAVLTALSKAHRPLSAYDIESRVPDRIPINVVTIYRVLEVLEKLGIAHRLLSKQGFVRCHFEEKPGCHHFAICDSCQTVLEFVRPRPCPTATVVPKRLHFKNLRHFAEVVGTCDYCSLTSRKR